MGQLLAPLERPLAPSALEGHWLKAVGETRLCGPVLKALRQRFISNPT